MSVNNFVDEIITIVKAEANNNPAPLLCKIVKNYDDSSYSDVTVEGFGILKYKRTFGSTDIGVEGVVVFIDGEINNCVVITPTKSETVDLSNVYEALTDLNSNKADVIHNHASNMVIENNQLIHIGTEFNASQSTINNAIDEKFNSLFDYEWVNIVTELPSASKNTKNKFYLIASATSGENKYDIYITVKSGLNYSWEKIDDANLVLTNYYTKNEVNNYLNNKANKNHSHNILDVNNLNNELNSKAEVNHGHAIANITGLSQALNNKANSNHSHDERYYTETEVDERILSLKTFTKLVVNASVDLYYNSFFVKINVHQLSNAGSGSLPVTYSHNIPQVYAPSYSLNVPLFNMKKGNPYGFMRLNSQGVLEIIINQATYNTGGGTRLYGSLMYIR